MLHFHNVAPAPGAIKLKFLVEIYIIVIYIIYIIVIIVIIIVNFITPSPPEVFNESYERHNQALMYSFQTFRAMH